MSETPENNLQNGDQISEAFQKILQNPDIISNVAAAIGMPLPSRENGVGEKSGSGITADTDALTALTPLFNSIFCLRIANLSSIRIKLYLIYCV